MSKAAINTIIALAILAIIAVIIWLYNYDPAADPAADGTANVKDYSQYTTDSLATLGITTTYDPLPHYSFKDSTGTLHSSYNKQQIVNDFYTYKII